MTVKEIVKKLDLTIFNSADTEQELTGCYIGDLLSHVMANARQGDIWLTVMGNINALAVAKLVETSAILLVEGIKPDQECISRANEQEITVLGSSKSAYELAVEISKYI